MERTEISLIFILMLFLWFYGDWEHFCLRCLEHEHRASQQHILTTKIDIGFKKFVEGRIFAGKSDYLVILIRYDQSSVSVSVDRFPLES